MLEESPNYVISMNVRSMNEPEDVPSMLLKLTYPADYPETSPLQIVRNKRHNKLLLNDNIKFYTILDWRFFLYLFSVFLVFSGWPFKLVETC